MKAYRQDFDTIATLITGADTSDASAISLSDITTDSMRKALARYAETHDAATIQRCWSTWNVLCTFLYTSELIVANPIPLVGRPKPAKLRQTRSRGDDGAVIHVHGKGGKDRRVPIEAALVEVLERYLDSRVTRFPGHRQTALLPRQGIGCWARKPQSRSLPRLSGHCAGSMTVGTSSEPPASSNRTLTSGFSARRRATAEPEEPGSTDDEVVARSNFAERHSVSRFR